MNKCSSTRTSIVSSDEAVLPFYSGLLLGSLGGNDSTQSDLEVCMQYILLMGIRGGKSIGPFTCQLDKNIIKPETSLPPRRTDALHHSRAGLILLARSACPSS